MNINGAINLADNLKCRIRGKSPCRDFLSVWVGLGILAGMVLGLIMPEVFQWIARLEYATTSHKVHGQPIRNQRLRSDTTRFYAKITAIEPLFSMRG